jgi:polysaccharide export outer membrane protein
MLGKRAGNIYLFLTLLLGLPAKQAAGQSPAPGALPHSSRTASETTEDYNRRIEHVRQSTAREKPGAMEEYRIGPEDLLEVSVFDAAELNRTTRVAAGGEISLPLLGTVWAAGLTPRELETVIEELLRRSFMKDPHVSVFVREMQSHSVSVFGAVKKPGVFQIRGAKTLVEMLSMAEGLAEDAGDTVLVVHRATSTAGAPGAVANTAAPGHDPAAAAAGTTSQEINLKGLLESGDPRLNVLVYPGDVVKVERAGIVYVVGEVHKPGGFELKSNENISVMQAVALAEGLTHTSARSQARIIRTDEATGARTEIPLNLDAILAGKTADPPLKPKDILFVPNSTGRSALYRGLEAALSVGAGIAVYRW